MYKKFKGSAIHNLIITGVNESAPIEGIFLGKDILRLADIRDGEEIIITRIGADSWGNRIKTVAFTSDIDGAAIISGSLTRFLSVGELTCVIAEIYNSDVWMNEYLDNRFPIFDLGFDPKTNKDNLNGNLDLQYADIIHKSIHMYDEEFITACNKRNSLLRCFVKSMICDLVVNHTHPDCLQGSAELPVNVMNKSGIEQYKSVSVYNCSVGGVADTYAVSMPEGVVMTTGAMASFAKLGEKVNVVSFVLDTTTPEYKIVLTDGKAVSDD